MRTEWLRVRPAAAVALLLALVATRATAQTAPASQAVAGALPALIHACYVPGTGSIYRIKTADTKETCSSSKHIEFSWNAQGEKGDPGTTDHSQLSSLDQDDHLQYLLAQGVRDSPAGFAVTGSFSGGGVPPASGAGTRLMWFPGRAAFRAGEVTATQWNRANTGTHSIAMGFNTTASGVSAVALGHETSATGATSTAMGAHTVASGSRSTAMGLLAVASAFASTAMGNATTASANAATAMGAGTEASGVASTAMGNKTVASGFAATAMGENTTASGHYSVAMGQKASTNNQAGSFVFGDTGPNTGVQLVEAVAPNQFVVRAQHVWLGRGNAVKATSGRFLETSTGGFLSNGGAWVNASSRAAKENFRAVDADEVLRRVADLEVQSWNYRNEDASVKHVGPIAQDFYRAFGLGGTDEAISTVDLGGINMLAIQALERRMRALAGELDAVREENAALRREARELERRIARLEPRRRR